MRKFLLATTAAALTLSGYAYAGHDGTANNVAPPETMSPAGLLFAKPDGKAFAKPERLVLSNDAGTPAADAPSTDAAQSAPAPAAAPATEKAAPADQPAPAAQSAPAPAEQAKPAEQATAPAASPAPAMAAADPALTAQIQTVVENKLKQFVPEERDRAGVLAFYKDRNFAPLWIASGKPTAQAEQAGKFLQGVSADGLDPADYPAPKFADSDPAKLAADELSLTNSVVTFARHASIGRVAFSRVSGAVFYDHKPPQPADVLAKLGSATDAASALNSYNPQSPQYKALKAELAAARSGKSTAAETKAPAKDEQDAKAHGKKGRHNDEAKAESKPKGPSVDTILANMERWRWMPHDLGAAYVMVNIPDFTLKVVQNGKTIWTTKIVDGKPGEHATPLLFETMKYITVNPTWNVPPSIIQKEYLPALAQDPDALTRIGLKVTHNPDGSIRIYQPPGDRNALGRIRFNFPNKFLVYQHDTPDKYLFAKSERAYSHGCMRVQNPDQYAEVLLNVSQPEEHYTAAKIRSMFGSSERNIQLKNHIPVYLTYQTAFVDDSGKPQSRADIYGLDRETLAVLHDKRTSDTPMARNYNSSSKPVRAASAGRDRGDYESRSSSYGWDRPSYGWNGNTAQNSSGSDRYRPN
jgi:murein L,D-transpeptidase YcbB/YkuD